MRRRTTTWLMIKIAQQPLRNGTLASSTWHHGGGGQERRKNHWLTHLKKFAFLAKIFQWIPPQGARSQYYYYYLYTRRRLLLLLPCGRAAVTLSIRFFIRCVSARWGQLPPDRYFLKSQIFASHLFLLPLETSFRGCVGTIIQDWLL